MINTLKDKKLIYLFNSYSNLNPKINFITGSDRVGIKLIEENPSDVLVIGPDIFLKNLPSGIKFISSDSSKYRNLFLRYFIRVFNTIKILWNKKKEFKNSIIISTSDFFPDIIPTFIFSNYFRWYAFTYHLYPLKFSIRNSLGFLLQIFSYLMMLKSYKVITTSRECENFLKKNFRIRNVLRIPLGINLNLYQKNSSKNKELVFLGRIKKSKGVYDLPEIISLVKKQYPEVSLNIIGNGSEAELKLLRDKISNYKVENNIKILTNLDDAEVIGILGKSKILVQPSYEEGFGLSILEALVSKMKVVAYRLHVYEEHFQEYSLNYAEIGDKIGFSKKIINLYENDSNFQNFNHDFSKFSWESVFNKIFND